MKDKRYYLELLKEKERRIEKQKAINDYSIFSQKYIKITDKKGKQVPLIQNHVQKEIHNKIEELQAKVQTTTLIV